MITNRSTTPSTYNSTKKANNNPLALSDFMQLSSVEFSNCSLEDCIKELPFDDDYYIREFGMDRRNYLIYQEMVAHTENFCDAFLDAEMNGTNGYQSFFV